MRFFNPFFLIFKFITIFLKNSSKVVNGSNSTYALILWYNNKFLIYRQVLQKKLLINYHILVKSDPVEPVTTQAVESSTGEVQKSTARPIITEEPIATEKITTEMIGELIFATQVETNVTFNPRWINKIK